MLILCFASSNGDVQVILLICAMYVGFACFVSLAFLCTTMWRTPEKTINSELRSCTTTSATSSSEGQKRS
jgi:hypothetical protein